MASIGFFEVDLAQANELEEIIFDSYLEGLDDAGWQGDPRQVRLGYSAASLRYRFASIWLGVEIVQDEFGRCQLWHVCIGDAANFFQQVGQVAFAGETRVIAIRVDADINHTFNAV